LKDRVDRKSLRSVDSRSKQGQQQQTDGASTFVTKFFGQGRGVVDLIKNFPLNYFDHHVKFGYCVSPYAGVCTDVPNILGTLGLTPWESGVHGPYKHTPPHVLPRRIWWFWVDRYKRRPTHVGIDPPKNGLLATRFSKSLKVIETDTGGAATYDW